MINHEVEQVAAYQFMLRPVLEQSLRQRALLEGGRPFAPPGALTMLDYWRGTYGDEWWNMTSVIRLGTAVEMGLRHCYQANGDGTKPPMQGIFQQLAEPSRLTALFAEHAHIELEALPCWLAMRKLMVHRHLYAHRAGFVDDRYINQWFKVAGEDIRPALVANGYPDQEICWFKPLSQVSSFIEDARTFFHALPGN